MKNRIFRHAIALLLGAFMLTTSLQAQVTNLSGTVNTYYDVTAVSTVANTVTLASVVGLATGDTVCMIQMQGASMNSVDAATFGDVSSLGAAGKFEFNIICAINANTITFDRLMLSSYDPNAGLQLIPIQHYNNVNITGTVTAPAWDGNLGGVVVIAAPHGWVQMNANIDASGKGFRGAARQDMVSGCSCANYATQYTSYFYPTATWQGALKGEGIASFIATKEAGRGKQVNGGGGGNDHNTGGAGGGNYGNGGNGGNAAASSCFFGSYCRGLNAGVGGLGLGPTYYSNLEGRLFMGGGGGAGHYGNASVGGGSAGGPGEVGGGIVIIWADSLNGNGFSITANGNNIIPTSAADGGGGGGAGGAVVLDVRSFHSNPVTASTRGGNGANHSWGAGANNCKGTGGGGGGGIVWFRGLANPPSISTNVTGGIAGVQGGASCTGLGNNGATNGANGSVLTSFARPFSTSAFSCGILPVQMAYFNANKSGPSAVALQWQTASEIGVSHFEIERATDDLRFETIGRLASSANVDGSSYQWKDNAPAIGTNWYRLRAVDMDGRSALTEAISVQFQGKQVVAITALYPNPVSAPAEAILELNAPVSTEATISVTDLLGKTIYQIAVSTEIGANAYRLPTQGLPAGIYFLKVNAGQYGEMVQKLRVN